MYPIGITSIADYLQRRGLRVQLINVAVRMLQDPKYDPERVIRGLNTHAFAIDLHWLPHAHGALELAQLCKKWHPAVPVIFGGFSATYFHDELIDNPACDYVVRGDSTEEPMLRLVSALRSQEPHTTLSDRLESIPNLVWNEEGQTRVNPLTNVPDNIDYAAVPAYRYVIDTVLRYRSLRNTLPYDEWLNHPTMMLLTARGCARNCPVCGGSQFGYQKVCNRSQPAFRSPEVLRDDVKFIQSFSRGPIFVVHDLRMGGMDYARRFLELVGELEPENEFIFELFDPAGEEYFELIEENIPRYSLELSLEAASVDVRKRIGKFACGDEKAVATIRHALNHGCRKLDVFYMVGVPGQTYEDALRIVEHAQMLFDELDGDTRIVPFVAPLAPFLDPGSPAYENPEEHGYIKYCHTLEDHRQAIQLPSWKHILSFETKWMDREELVDATYEVAEGLNTLKFRHGVVDEETYEETKRGISAARGYIDQIDEVLDSGLSGDELDEALAEIREGVQGANDGTLCGRDELKWPVGGHFVNFGGLLRLGASVTWEAVKIYLQNVWKAVASNRVAQ
jgi:B12-binding domain/radical SAM domain protein